MSSDKLPLVYNLLNGSVLYAFVLFTILVIVFFFYVSNIVEDNVNSSVINEIDNYLTDENIKSILGGQVFEEAYKIELLLLGIRNRKTVDEYVEKLKNRNNREKQINNSSLVHKGVMTVVFLFIIVLLLNTIPKFLCKYNILLTNNIGQLILILSITVLISVLLFSKFAVKYVPILPSELIQIFKDKALPHLK
jgi:hypothetical protein